MTVENIDGEPVSLQTVRGKKAYIVVNVASEWRVTSVHYKQFQQLYSDYADAGLEILAFPCNNFGAQVCVWLSNILGTY